MQLGDLQPQVAEGVPDQRGKIAVAGVKGGRRDGAGDRRDLARHPFVERCRHPGLVRVRQCPEAVRARLSLRPYDVGGQHAVVCQLAEVDVLVEVAPDRQRQTLWHDVTMGIDQHFGTVAPRQPSINRWSKIANDTRRALFSPWG